MEPLESLTLQAAVNFFSSMAGMAVFMYMYCPNHRCCRTTDIRSLLECENKLKSLESDKKTR